MSETSDRAEALAGEGRAEEAIALLRATPNDPDSCLRLGAWLLSGQRIRRDLAASRAAFAAAGQLGHREGAAIHRAFTASGVGGPADFPAAMVLLRAAARADAAAARQLEIIGQMALAPDGRPMVVPSSRSLSESPQIAIFERLLSGEECRYLSDTAAPRLRPSVVIDPRTGESRPDPVRISRAAAFPFALEDPAVHAINLRLAAASRTRVEQGEPLTIIDYRPGERYRPHLDALPGAANQREITIIVYLNDGYRGGETRFPDLGLTITPRQGDAILFRNVRADGLPDPRTIHEGLPVLSGEKRIATRWIRSAPLLSA